MGLSMEQIAPIKEELERDHLFNDPLITYVTTCGYSKIGFAQKSLSPEFHLNPGESLDDLCLSVILRSQPPADVAFPHEYKGVWIFYKIGGDTKPQ